MITIPELLRSRATQIGEIRRTGSQTLATALLRDLFVIADGMDAGDAIQAIADRLSDSPIANVPAPTADVSAYPYLATFRGQGEQLGHIVDLDDRYQFPVTALEAEEAAGPEGLQSAVEFDALAEAATAPAEVKNWSGPFEIDVARRLYRIEQIETPDSFDIYADTIDEVRTLVQGLLETDARDKGVSIPAPAAHALAALDDRAFQIAGGTIVIAGPAYDIHIVQQDPELTAQRDAIF